MPAVEAREQEQQATKGKSQRELSNPDPYKPHCFASSLDCEGKVLVYVF